MVVLVTYDVSTRDAAGRRRLRRVAQECQNYGTRVQKSVFECVVRPQDWVKLRSRLLTEYDQREDSLRFYFLEADARKQIEHHGVREPVDVEGTLIV